jgi:hypothetical protein
MKTTKITYWISTGIVALMMTYSALAYLTQPIMTQAFEHLGYPSHFRVELAVAKIIGVVLLLAPVGQLARQLAYSGFALVFISAFIAHTAAGDPASARIMPLVFLVILAVSFASYNKLQQQSLRFKASA